MEAVRSLATLLSICLTIPTIVLALRVVYIWLPSVRNPRELKTATPEQWFILGVAVSFFGSVLDNSYWQLAWSMEYAGCPETQDFIFWGPLFNIPFRQVSGIVAAGCHIKAAEAMVAKKDYTGLISNIRIRGWQWWLGVSSIAGVAYCMFLEIVK